MEDPSVTAARLTATAKDVVDQARVIAKKGIADAADTKNFTAAKLVDSYMKMVDLALSGGMQATKDVLGVDAPADGSTLQTPEAAEGRKLVVDAMESIGRRMLRQTSAVAQETAGLLDKNPNSPTIWAKAMVKLADISMLGGIELAETALIGPAPFEKDAIKSNRYQPNGAGRRRLKIKPPGLMRPGTADPIPAALLRFFAFIDNNDEDGTEDPDGILEIGQTQFCIAALPTGMISGMYVGEVQVVAVNANGTDGAVLQTVVVEIPL